MATTPAALAPAPAAEPAPGRRPPDGRRELLTGSLGAVVLGAAVFGLGYAAVALTPAGHGVAVWWPAAGVSVIALMRSPRSRWPLLAVTIMVASGMGNVVAGRSLAVSAGFGLTNALEALVVAWWLVRGRRTPRLASPEDLARLLVATLLGGLVIGLGAGITDTLGTGGDFLLTARTVMASHGAAMLVVVPLGMVTAPVGPTGRRWEIALQWVTMTVITAVVFWPTQSIPMQFLSVPVLVWGAVRMTARGVAVQLSALAVAVTVSSRAGGPFAEASSPALSVALAQAYLVVCALVALALVTSAAQRRLALREVAASERLFRLSFSEALLGTLLLQRCVPEHATGSGTVAAERPDALDHAGGGLDIVQLNGVAARILAGGQTNLVGASWTGRLETGDRAMLADAVARMADGALSGWHGELAVRSRDTVRWVEVGLAPLDAGEGMFVAQMVDVTARRQAEERLTAQALQDGLTGLANRVLLRDRIDLALRTLGPEDPGVILAFCDLDDFKLVNDSAGHSSGDSVLVEVAARLRGLLRPEDLAARLGGDEFVLLRPRGDEAEAEGLAAQVLDALAVPMVVAGQSFVLGASIGITLGTAGASADDMLRDADAAMYVAKREGKRRAVVYSDEHRARHRRAVRIESELRQAVARDELEMYLQPVVDLADGRIVAAEALVRWNHPERGVLGPVEWLDIAESAGLMPQIGTWVLQRSCALAAGWAQVRPSEPAHLPQLHVNVSARQLEVPGFIDVVRDALARSGLPADRLVLEVTETYLHAVSDTLLADLAELRRSGCGLAADDFGTGYSPLTRLIDLPLSMVKIDRRFVHSMLEDVRSRAIVTTLVRLSESLGLALVAEGVESEQQAQALREVGCTVGQGYLWSRPVPADRFVQLLSRESG